MNEIKTKGIYITTNKAKIHFKLGLFSIFKQYKSTYSSSNIGVSNI